MYLLINCKDKSIILPCQPLLQIGFCASNTLVAGVFFRKFATIKQLLCRILSNSLPAKH